MSRWCRKNASTRCRKAWHDAPRPKDRTAPGNAEHTFAGLLRCASCESGMKLASGTGRSGKAYYYYACNAQVQGRKVRAEAPAG